MAQRIVFVPIIAALLLLGAPTVFAEYQESPLLAARVAAGDLPPVEERLPSNPFVRQVEEEIGRVLGHHAARLAASVRLRHLLQAR